MNPTRAPQPAPLDLITIEREARRLQAEALAVALRQAIAWLRGRLTGTGSARPA